MLPFTGRRGCKVLSASDIRAGRSVQCWFSTDKIFYVHIICLSTQVCVWESVSQLLLFARTCDQYICKNQPNEISINSVKIPFVNEFSIAVGTYSPYCSPYISYGTSKENLSKYQEILSLVITFFILIT